MKKTISHGRCSFQNAPFRPAVWG